MKKTLKRAFSLFLIVSMCLSSFAFAEGDLTNVSAIRSEQSKMEVYKNQPGLSIMLERNASSVKSLNAPYAKSALMESTSVASAASNQPISIGNDPRGTINGSLTSASDQEIYVFSATEAKFMIGRLKSDNPDLNIQLYVVDPNTGNAQPTSISAQSNGLISLNGLPQGMYAFVVTTSGSASPGYTLQLNVTNPSGSTSKVISVDLQLLHFAIEYADGKVYANGEYIYNVNTPSKLDWERVYYFSYGGNYNQRTHSIDEVKVSSIKGPVSYSSSYASSSRAMLVYLDVDTLFMHHVSGYTSSPPTHQDSFLDTLGKKTPRRLEADDYSIGDHILVYDINTGKAIDFFSALNYYYGSGVEDIPTITFIQ